MSRFKGLISDACNFIFQYLIFPGIHLLEEILHHLSYIHNKLRKENIETEH